MPWSTKSARGLTGATPAPKQADPFYRKNQWVKFRKWFLSRHPMCADPFNIHRPELGGPAPASVVDHITPRRELPREHWLSEEHCQALCKTCHGKKTGMGQ